MGKNSLAPGVRFHPTDEELVMYYLKRKVLGKKISFKAIAEVDIYKHAPWDLPDMSCLKTGDLKWFFYCPIEKKYARGARLNRATVYGYWKTTGKDRPVKYNEEVVGMIKTLVFHQGKAPRGDRTDWVMHEYRLAQKDLADRGVVQDTYVLCVVFEKNGMGPRNGAQYGAPFKEEDWSDDEDTNLPGTGSLSNMSTLPFGGAGSSCVLEIQCAGPSVESSGLYTLPLVSQANASVSFTTDIDSNGYVAPTWSDDEDANLPDTGCLSSMSTVPVGGASSSCVPESQCPGPSVESNELYTLHQVVHANATVSFTAGINNSICAAPIYVGGPREPVVTDAKAVPALLEAPQFAPEPEVEESNGSILSMLELFTAEDAFTTYDMGQMIGNANNCFCLAPQVADDDDILSMLADFGEDNNLNNVLYPFE